MTNGIAPLPKVLFIHITKSGGSTFRQILQTLYGPGFHFCVDPDIPNILSALDQFQAVEFHRVTTGSENYFVHNQLVNQLVDQKRWDLLADIPVFAMFRDPVAHYFSYYNYVANRRAIAEPILRAQGLKFPESLEEFMTWDHTYNQQLASFLGQPDSKVPSFSRYHLEAAKEMMIRLRVRVGLTERFAESMHIFETVTGLQIPGRRILNKNRRSGNAPREPLPAEIADRIRNRCALDQELYEFSKQVFLRDLELCGPVPAYTFIEETDAPGADPQGV
jgi:hypothetical protein